jgi:type IV pilus assembly protein PilW
MGGFTLIEMMIAIALGLIILAALTTFFIQSSANRAEMERGSRQIENGRFAMNALREDVAVAGFYYDIAQSTVAWQTPAACTTAVGSLGFSVTPRQLPLPIFGYAGGTGAPACVADAVADTDVLVIRRFNTEPTAVGSAVATQNYVQVSHCRTDSLDETFVAAVGSAGAGTFNLHEVDCSTVARLWRYREHVYYVRNYSATAGDGVPTLVRIENGAAAEPLVEGIQAMRVEYGIDNGMINGVLVPAKKGDGMPDEWRRCVAATPCSTDDWSRVMALRVYVLSSNLESSPGYSDTKTYDMGLAGTLGPFNNAFKRHVYTAVLNATNRSGLLER